MTSTLPESAEWLTREQVAEVLQVSPRTVDRYVKLGALKSYTVGPVLTVRFRRSDIDSAMVERAK